MEKVLVIETANANALTAVLASLQINVKSSKVEGNNTEYTVEVTDAQLQQLQALQGIQKSWGVVIRDGANKVAGVITDAADFAVNDLAIPIGTVATKTAAAVGRIGIKAAAQTGASIINNVVDEGVRTVADIKKNDEYQKLTGQSWNTIKSLFTGSSKQAFTIK